MAQKVMHRQAEKWLKERFIHSVYGLFVPIAITGVMAGYYGAQEDASNGKFLVTTFVLLLLDLLTGFYVVEMMWERWKRWDQFRAYMRSDIPSLEAQRFAREAVEEHRQAMLPSEDS